MIDKIIQKIKNKKIAILGFGREGKSTYLFIRKHLPFINLVIIDELNMSESSVINGDKNISFIYGDDYLKHLDKFDLIIKTPGISLKDIDCSKLNITSQIELILEVAKNQIIGVTGTKGKSTTTQLIYSILKANELDAVCVGNVGIPVFDKIEEIKEDTMIVIEMSSHQLEFLDISPHIGIVLNLFEDHLDHAGNVKRYHEIKMHMFSNQTADDYMIYCKDNTTLNRMILANSFKGKQYSIDMHSDDATVYLKNEGIYYCEEKVFPSNMERNLLGNHNLENMMVAFAVSRILKLDDEKSIKALQEFKALSYRLELIGKVSDVNYYVDTLATVPEATLEAIRAIPNVNTLIFGGMDRGISYEGFALELAKSDIENFICMPETGYKIAQELPKDKVYLVETLEEACNLAKKVTKKNMACILSPAASSYNHFKNYADKGDRFKEYILNK